MAKANLSRHWECLISVDNNFNTGADADADADADPDADADAVVVVSLLLRSLSSSFSFAFGTLAGDGGANDIVNAAVCLAD